MAKAVQRTCKRCDEPARPGKKECQRHADETNATIAKRRARGPLVKDAGPSREIQLADIAPDPNQPRRKDFARWPTYGFKTEDIVSSIQLDPARPGHALAGKGIIQGILVRKTPPGTATKRPWTILIGERRYVSALAKGLVTIPASVVEIEERDVRAVQLLENLARVDLSPLEMADSIAALKVELGRKVTLDELAFRTGLTVPRVHEALAVAGLAPTVREALEGRDGQGHMALGVALALVSLSHEDQATALPGVRQMVRGQDARRWVDARYHLRLVSGCGFDPTDSTLLPGVGPCSRCPSNTATQRALFSEGAGEEGRCTDRECFDGKKLVTQARAETLTELVSVTPPATPSLPASPPKASSATTAPTKKGKGATKAEAEPEPARKSPAAYTATMERHFAEKEAAESQEVPEGVDGWCGASCSPSPGASEGDAPADYHCALPSGHEGMHSNGHGVSWDTDGVPEEPGPPSVPPPLSVIFRKGLDAMRAARDGLNGDEWPLFVAQARAILASR